MKAEKGGSFWIRQKWKRDRDCYIKGHLVNYTYWSLNNRRKFSPNGIVRFYILFRNDYCDVLQINEFMSTNDTSNNCDSETLCLSSTELTTRVYMHDRDMNDQLLIV